MHILSSAMSKPLSSSTRAGSVISRLAHTSTQNVVTHFLIQYILHHPFPSSSCLSGSAYAAIQA